MVKQNIWNELGKAENADIPITIGIGFQLLPLMSGLPKTKTKKKKSHPHIMRVESIKIAQCQVFLRCVYFPPVR